MLSRNILNDLNSLLNHLFSFKSSDNENSISVSDNSQNCYSGHHTRYLFKHLLHLLHNNNYIIIT